jgi:hypothetical protein
MASASVSIACAAVFLIILILLHFLKRELDPSWRMISEYEIGRFGWLMRLAFFAWGTSVLALLVTIWPSLGGVSGAVARGWFVVIVIALFGAGIFKTNPITDQTPNPVSTIHNLCGATVILTFPIAATLAVISLLHNQSWSTYQGLLIMVTTLGWVGMGAYFASVMIARARNPMAGQPGGPVIYMGWTNRFNVGAYVLWVVVVAATALRV